VSLALPVRNSLLAVATICAFSIAALAGVVGNVRGIVHDPHHRPIRGARVSLQSSTSQWKESLISNGEGFFEFSAVPLGEYSVTVHAKGFRAQTVTLLVTSGSAPILHFPLEVEGINEAVEVSGTPIGPSMESAVAETVVNRRQIARTPGADGSNSMAFITDYVPSAVMVHDQLHLRGGHQVTWAIDGVPLPNTNIASNVGPQFDPRDIDYVELQRGGYSAEYGDRTYGVINVATRTGFERDRQAELITSYGNYNTTDDQLSFGDHTTRFAYYTSLRGNRTDYGLEPPTSVNLHNQNSGGGIFTSLVFNATPSDQFRFTGASRADYYQVPNDPTQQAAGIRDRQREQDTFGTFTWLHTFSPGALLSVSPFYHFNRAAFEGGPNDVPSATDNRSSQYAGGQASLALVHGRHNARVGLYAFSQHDNTLFAIAANDGSGNYLRQRRLTDGNLEAVFAEDEYRISSWLTLTGGVRFTHFSGILSETATSPRVSASLRIPFVHWYIHGSYDRFYQAPPLETVSGPLLEYALSQGVGFLPLHGERDEQHEVGLTIPLRRWTVSITNFRTGARNYFDHDAVGNSNIFFPLTIAHARIQGTEVAVRSPQIHKTISVHLAYSNQMAQGYGAISGGLTDFSPPPDVGFYLDHDQRNTLSTGFIASLPHHAWLSSNFEYGSGFLNADGPQHLPSYRTVDLAVGKDFGERWSAKVVSTNLTNKRYQIDLSNTFGGSHFGAPRMISVQLRYRFRY